MFMPFPKTGNPRDRNKLFCFECIKFEMPSGYLRRAVDFPGEHTSLKLGVVA